MKAIESVLLGAHWSVAQRLEVTPTDFLAMAGREEMVTAQRVSGAPRRAPKGQEQQHEGTEESKQKGKGKSSGKDTGRQKEETTSK